MAAIHRLIRDACGFLSVAALVLTLNGCAGGGQPFSKSSGGSSTSGGKTAPPVTLIELKGLPAEKKQPLTDLLVQAAATHDIAIVQGAFGDGLRLDGAFTIESNSSGTVVGYDWKLADPSGRLLQSFSGAEIGAASSGNAWTAVTSKVLEQVAASTANTLAAKLAQMGYATRAAALSIPVEAFAAAGPEEGTAVDYETLYGPQIIHTPLATAAGEPPPPAQIGPQPALAALQTASKPDAQSSARAGTIRAIALVSVSGLPGDGNRELKEALRRFLTEAGWPGVDLPQDGALTVKGSVKLSPPQGKDQRVALAWAVFAPDGRTLGTIKQANTVPAGSLDHGWGKMASPAAQSAAEGLFQMVDRMR